MQRVIRIGLVQEVAFRHFDTGHLDERGLAQHHGREVAIRGQP
jgi:hypothetical protein